LTSLVVYGPFRSNDDYLKGKASSHGCRLSESKTYNAYTLLTHMGLKLPLVVFTYAYLLDILYGNLSFVILTALITIAGVLLMSFGQIAYARISLIVASGVLIGLSALLFWFPASQLAFIKNQFIDSASIIFTLSPWHYAILGIVSAGLWLGSTRQNTDGDLKEPEKGNNKNILSVSALIVSFLYFFSILLSRGRYFFSVNGELSHDISFNGFILIIVSGACLLGLMSVFYSISSVFANNLFVVKQNQTNGEIRILVSRFTIVLSVAISILLVPLVTKQAGVIIEKILFVYLILSIPVLVLRIFHRFRLNTCQHTIKYSLIGGWILGVLIIVLYLFQVIIVSEIINLITYLLCFCGLLTYAISIIFSKVGAMKLEDKSRVGIL